MKWTQEYCYLMWHSQGVDASWVVLGELGSLHLSLRWRVVRLHRGSGIVEEAGTPSGLVGDLLAGAQDLLVVPVKLQACRGKAKTPLFLHYNLIF